MIITYDSLHGHICLRNNNLPDFADNLTRQSNRQEMLHVMCKGTPYHVVREFAVLELEALASVKVCVLFLSLLDHHAI